MEGSWCVGGKTSSKSLTVGEVNLSFDEIASDLGRSSRGGETSLVDQTSHGILRNASRENGGDCESRGNGTGEERRDEGKSEDGHDADGGVRAKNEGG